MTGRWPLVVFHNILDISSYNAFVIWREINPDWMRGKRNKRRVFLQELGEALVTPFIARRERIPRTEASAAVVKAVKATKRKSFLNQQTIPAAAQRASYEVADLIAQAKKPHTISETLIKPAAVDKYACDLESVPLSNGTIARRITDMAQDIKCQLVDRVKKGKYASQLDESIDILNSAQLLVFIRYSFDGKRNAVCIGLIVRVRGCAQHYIPHPGSVGVASLWHRYFGGRGLKSLGTPVLEHHL